MVRKCAGLAIVCLTVSVTSASATTLIDLTTSGSSGSGTDALFGNEFVVQWVAQASTGTGVIEPFLRVQKGGNEQGYNTELGGPLDDKTGTWTHALNLSAVPIVNIGGVDYRQFLLDINEDNSTDGRLLSLNQIQIFQGPDQLHTGFSSVAGVGTQPIITFGQASEIFRLNNASGDLEIRLNFGLNPGSGAGDMFLYVANAAFDTAIPNVIFYTQFGAPSGYASSNAGFEEWAIFRPGDGDTSGQQPVPEPAALALFGTGLAVLARTVRSRKRD